MNVWARAITCCAMLALGFAAGARADGGCDAAYGALAATPSGTPAAHRVNVILSLGFKGTSIDRASAEVQKRRYEELYPGERTVIVQARSADELRAATRDILGPGDVVHRLFVDSHGSRNDLYYGVFDIVFLDPSQPYLQGPDEFSRALEAFKGRFAPDALITFEGCKLFSEDRLETSETMSKLMDQLGMSSGRVYGNYTDGTNFQDDYIKPKFHDLHDWPSCLAVGAANALWPVSEAFSGLADYVIANHGYLYTRVDAGTRCIDPARMMNMRD